MKLMNATFIVRVLLLLSIALFAWWFFIKRGKEYDYTGLSEYHSKYSLLNSFIDHFVKQKTTKKPRQYNKSENQCRKILEKLYPGHKFPTIRPDFLKSPRTGKNLELDCYNPELKLALEYNGAQHYTYNKHFHRSKKDFYSQVHRDDWKRKRCKELGIRLIEIPHWVQADDMKEYIVRQLKKKGCL